MVYHSCRCLSDSGEGDAAMRKSDVRYVVGSVFASATSVLYCMTMLFDIKLPRYYPTEHVWKWVNESGVPSQGWYGMQVFAFLFAGILSVVVWLVVRRLPSEKLSAGATKLLGVAATMIVVICMTYIMCHEYSKWGIL